MLGLIRIVGIRFKRAGKIYYFDPGDLSLRRGDQVLVETASSLEFGDVVVEPKLVPEDEVVQPLRKVVRMANSDDLQQLVANRRDERAAHSVALERIAAHGLPMRLVNTEYTFDRNRLTFFFTADNRVDFRALVHDLAKRFGVRIELRQIGVRDEAKDMGGIGVCGRELCCTSWMGEFAPVSIRMAKQQQLSLNPSKLTGQCGRLKCCLKFENDTYRAVRELLPEPGDKVAVVASAVKLPFNDVETVTAVVNGRPTQVIQGVVREVLVTKESVLVDIGEGNRIFVSLKQIESGEAVVLTGKLVAGGDGKDERESAAAEDVLRQARAEGAAGADDDEGDDSEGRPDTEGANLSAVRAPTTTAERSVSEPAAGVEASGVSDKEEASDTSTRPQGRRSGKKETGARHRRRRRPSRRRQGRPRQSGE